MTWTTAALTQAANDWIWVPEEAPRVETDDYLVVDFPPGYDDDCPTQVQWTRSDRPAGEIIDEVVAHVQGWETSRLGWWIRLDTRPTEVEAALLDRGAVLHDTVGVLARELGSTPPPAEAGVSWRLVADEETLRDARTVYREVWDGPERTPEQWQTDLDEARQPVAERPMFQVVGYIDDEPASAGGCTRVGDIARLWGAASRPALRGRGAYRAVTDARLAIAQDLGTTLGLVKGRLSTSGPILQRLGFTSYGEERLLVLDL